MATPYGFSNIYPKLAQLLKQRGGNNSPHKLDGTGGVSGMSAWIRVVSGVEDGLVLESIGGANTFDMAYGSHAGNKSGMIGTNFGGTPIYADGTDRALRPSPVITNFASDDYLEGTRQITFKIKCFTLPQAQKLAEYYLEGGFHVLIEWGWNTSKSRSQLSPLTVCDIVKYNNWRHITNKWTNSDYQYDAVLGIVVGGGIKFGDNETYELEVKVTGMGQPALMMQTHRDANPTSTPKKDSGLTFTAEEIDSATGNPNIGKGLFMQMFNELPGQKRTALVKKLIDTPDLANAANFINMDKVMRDSLSDTLSKADTELKTGDDTKEAKIPKDVPLVTKDRFIRFELACAIINAYPIKLEPQGTGCGKSRSQKINIENTVIAGFPHMFSTDRTKLVIPNTTAPNFKLVEALSATKGLTDFIDFGNLNNNANLANLHPQGDASTPTNSNGSAPGYGGFSKTPNYPVPYAFPAKYKLSLSNGQDSTFDTVNEDIGFWGHLKNLYINFDFFVECISKPNLVVRDVFHEMLNGMSSACNSIWKFHITETINPTTGDLEMTVQDLNFSGIVDVDGVTSFQSRGVESPFLECDFSVEVSQAQMSSQVQKKQNDSFDHGPEVNPRTMRGNVWSNREDKVSSMLYGLKSIKPQEKVTVDNNAPKSKKSAEELENDARAANYEYYTKTGAVVPKVQDRNGKLDVTKTTFDMAGNDTTIQELLQVVAWNDTAALRQVFLVDKGLASGGAGGRSKSSNNKQNPPFGVGSFNFKVHGVPGFKVNDKFRIDGVPKQFTYPNFFQIVKINHTLDGMMWTTDVTGEFRTIGQE